MVCGEDDVNENCTSFFSQMLYDTLRPRMRNTLRDLELLKQAVAATATSGRPGRLSGLFLQATRINRIEADKGTFSP